MDSKVSKGYALVTGSSSGIGRAIACRLAADGYKVIAHFNKNEEGAAQTARLITEMGGQVTTLQFNVSDKTSVESTLETFLKDKLDTLDVLVNNAGIHQDTLAGIMSDEAFDAVVKTNMYGAFYLMRFAVRKMMRARRGSIVNVASLAGQTGNAGQINYAASKAGLIAMTKTLAMEMGSRQVRVNAVAPGFIETEMINDIPGLEEFKKRIPLGRFGKPEDVAGAVSFLCSKDAEYITGSTISINGGLYPA